MDKIKQVIIVRNDLKMPKGKLAAQVSHASLGAFLKHLKKDYYNNIYTMDDIANRWLEGSFFKVVLKVESEQELREISSQIQQKQIAVAEIVDAGHTVFKEPTFTCIGIGPIESSTIDSITGHLRLL